MRTGDAVTWGTPQGRTQGRTVERRTQPFQFESQQFNASEEEPYWIVESDRTGARAAHKESTVRAS